MELWFENAVGVGVRGALHVTTVTDIKVIVIARQALLVKVGRAGTRGGFSGAGQGLENGPRG